MKIKITHPLISCICVTANRPDDLLKSIISFDRQNYPNREIVISYPEDDQTSAALVDNIIQLSEIRIVVLTTPATLSIGMARNQAIQASNGDYVCLWDDDDWYHEKRLAHQYNTMKMKASFKEASMLSHVLLFDALRQRAFMSLDYPWAGTLLCRKDILLEHPFSDTNAAEDAPVLSYLQSKKLVHFVADSAFLYVYAYHGQNAGDYYHFSYFTRKSELLDKESTAWVKSLFESKVSLAPS